MRILSFHHSVRGTVPRRATQKRRSGGVKKRRMRRLRAGVRGPTCYAKGFRMSAIEITLPDGSKQSVAPETRPIDIAKGISPRLADAAIVAKVNGELFDLTRPLEKDASLQILTAKDPEARYVYRHSTAHLLAAAGLELYPETKLGIGPPIETGFYYAFDRATPFTPEDLEKIEKKMWEIQQRQLPYERVYTKKEEGLRKYADAWMKCELIQDRAGEVFSEYTLGPHFIDFCRGPHLPNTSKI